MDISPQARERLEQLMDARRLDLDMNWRDVAQRAGISYEAIRALRSGPGGIRSLTARKIDRALQWKPGSLERILDGGDPELIASPDGERALVERAREILDRDEHRNGTTGLAGLT